MFKARSESAVAGEGLEESAADHRVHFDSNPRVFRSRGSSLASPGSPATPLYFSKSSTRQLSGLNEEGEGEDDDDEDKDVDEVEEGTNAGAVKKEMIEIQESQKLEWAEMVKDNESLRSRLKEAQHSQNASQSKVRIRTTSASSLTNQTLL
jgi:hypothetical protein